MLKPTGRQLGADGLQEGAASLLRLEGLHLKLRADGLLEGAACLLRLEGLHRGLRRQYRRFVFGSSSCSPLK